jgi:hypothetical protein
VVPSLILIYRCEFLCVFCFIIALFTTALFTIQLKRKDGSVGNPPIEGTRLADQSRKHPFAQLNSPSLRRAHACGPMFPMRSLNQCVHAHVIYGATEKDRAAASLTA